MPDDSLPSIAILGSGPIGLEAALYARYLGYPVHIYERSAAVAANVLDWEHVTLFTPFRMNATSLGVAALQAQNPQWEMPAAEALLTGAEFHEAYLKPLAESDLLSRSLQLETEVVSIGRQGWLKSQSVGSEERSESTFHLLLRKSNGEEFTTEADVVIDCTGTYGNHNWLGQGGIPAIGESAAKAHIEYGLPDVVGKQRERYAGKKVLVVGAGYSAATTITEIAEIAEVTWATRSDRAEPVPRIPEDRLPNRDQLAAAANQLAISGDSPVTHRADTSVTSVEYRAEADDFLVVFDDSQTEPERFDRIIANVGYHPDLAIYRELQVHECYATEGPMKLAAQLQSSQADGPTDCLDQVACGPQNLLNPETDFYILGSKSYGRSSNFLLNVGHQQIRDLFTIIGEREDLDIYATMPPIA